MRTKRVLAMVMALLIAITMLPSMVFASAPAGELDGKLKLKGTAEVGGTLSADYKKVTPENLTDEYVTFQWSRKDGKELTEVGTESTYTPTEEDLGYSIVLKITGDEGKGITGSLTAESQKVAAAGEGVSEEEINKEESTAQEEVQAEEAELGADGAGEPDQDAQTDETTDPVQDAEMLGNTELPQDQEQSADSEEDQIIENMTENEEVLEIPEESGESSSTGAEVQEEPLTYSAEAVTEDGTNLVDFGTVSDTETEAKYVTVTNTGTGELNFEEISPEHFMVQDISEPLQPGEQVSLWIQPREGLEPGSYQDTITYESEEGGSASFFAAVSVEAAETSAAADITADTDKLEFTDLQVGYSSVEETKTVQITNNGTADVTLKVPESAYFDLTADSETDTVVKAGESRVFSVMPKVGLAAGEYSEELVFSVQEDENAVIKVSASVKVAEASEGTVSADVADVTFQEVEEGYETVPEAQTVTLTNNGTDTVILVQPESENFEIGALSAAELKANESAAFTVQPKAGLAAGIYEEKISVYNEDAKELTSVMAKIKVAEKAVEYQLEVTPDYLDFGSAEEGYGTAPKAQEVTVTNSGTGEINLIHPASDFFTVSEFSKTKLQPGESVVFTIQPKTGLEVSEYLEVIQIENEEGAYGLVNAYFNVTEKTETSNILKSIQKPADITGLANGTEKSVKGLKLPSTVVISASKGKMKASVSWDVNGCSYDPKNTQAQSFTVKGKVTLPDGVENPNEISLITSVNVSVKGYSAKVVSSDDNKITGIDPNAGYTTESKISFTAVGAGMDNENPGTGDTRFIPLNWTIVNTNGWQQAPYSATFRMSRSGTYTLSVSFNEQKYDGEKWANTGASDTKSVSFKVSDPVGQTVTPTPGAQSKQAVKTGDDTNVLPFVIALVVAVICVAGVVIYRKRK